jgi:soluble lytic murein transglycosylase-like protein
MKRQLMYRGRRLYGSVQIARGALGRFGGRAGQSMRPAFFFGLAVTAGLGLIAAGPVERAAGAQAELEPVVVASVADDLVSTAWRKRALERERERNVPEFAAAFSIPSELAEKIYVAAQTHEIEPEIAFGLVRAESSFRRTVVSHAGAVGFTQLLPSTARWIAPGTTRAALFDPETNLDVGFRYLRYLKDKYEGDVTLALTAYNRGQGRVDRDLQAGRNPDNGYAAAVLTGKVSRTLIRQNSPRG